MLAEDPSVATADNSIFLGGMNSNRGITAGHAILDVFKTLGREKARDGACVR